MTLSLRRLLELVSRDVVLRRRLPQEFGRATLFVTPESRLRFWLPGVSRAEPGLLAFARDLVRPGDIVWDVGANLGLFAFAAAALAENTGNVVAFEADPRLCSLMRRSNALQPSHAASVQIVHAAVSDACGAANFYRAQRGLASSSLIAGGSTQAGGVRDVLTVPTITLDSMLQRWPAPRVLKIDVEAGEHLVVRGAARVLSEVRPTVLCEVYEQNEEEVTHALHAASYRLFDAALPPAQRVLLSRAVSSTLALP